ncbi:MBL fold metallo-hydrolase [Arthrobacter sp. EH-1B-1]|uniref:MBL fold metallo-hydrolase n=1 Tax=Arthrobacter vasquezii TaxID=2977629 RepID=A0ABT6CY10_9MICC|nr:MBL fold metallo-hydrolase [Arthrobacter vasquezii]MDF9277949.1 MBL fold metallo-hydrolase [Arthrobacter vasquezii]
MRINVVNVGDGACTVLRHQSETMVMDCGSWHSSDGKDPAMLLRATLGAVASMPSTVVVTHFDLDHWLGLKAFADASPSGSEHVRLIHPRLPSLVRPVQASLLAYQTLHFTAPERSSLDLFQAWESKSAVLSRTSACAGNIFTAVGTRWKVLWPPRELEARVSNAFARVAKEAEDLAKEYEPLRRALDWANNSPFFMDDDEEQANDLLDEFNPVVDEDVALPGDYDLFDSYAVDGFADAPDGLRERLQKNRRDVQRINNELSLVVEEVHGRFLNLGDIQKWGLNELIRRRAMQECYDTILAPHHGTQAPGVRTASDFPWSRLVIAQNGAGHHPRLRKELSAHTHKLISTADSGSVTIRGRYHCPTAYCSCRHP